MESEAEKFRMQHAGLVARSAQGHAAKGMKIKDQEDMWVNIQHNTFRNWVNVQLRETGIKVKDLSNDLTDGVALVTLVEVLQNRKLKKITKVINQHQALENVTTALNSIADDGIKLVNIGNVDIVNGNLKLILGLIWSLIMHYQIGQTQFPPKKLMLSWLKASLPNCDVNNFTTDWNSGVNLGALIDYCKPGTFRSWKQLDPKNSVDNCKKAMHIANKEFNIPMVLEPEYLASPYLDELSGMTYLSYFMKEGGPGYKATLKWVQDQLPEKNIKNFTTNWNDGKNLGALIKKLGGYVEKKDNSGDPTKWEDNIQSAMDAGKKLGVEPALSAHDMARPDVEYLGPMTYLSYFQWIKPKKLLPSNVKVKCDMDYVRVNNPVTFNIEISSKDVNPKGVKTSVVGPKGPVKVKLDIGPRGGNGSFFVDQVGFYELKVKSEDGPVEGSPFRIRALPDVSKIMFSGLEPCRIGSVVEVMINSNGAGDGEIKVTGISPSRRSLKCPVKVEDGVYAATFQPDEAGRWSIEVTYDEEHIQGSPFACEIYDPNAIKVLNLDDGPGSITGREFTIVLDATQCGWGEAKADVTLNGKSYPSKTFEVSPGFFETTFTPVEVGKYKIYVYYNGHEVRGSPFPLYLGVEKPPERKYLKSSKKKSSKSKDVITEPVIKEYSSKIASPAYRGNNVDGSNSKIHVSSYKVYNSNEFDKTDGYREFSPDLKDTPVIYSSKGTSFDSSAIDRYGKNSLEITEKKYNSLNRMNNKNSYQNCVRTHERSSLSPERSYTEFSKERSFTKKLFDNERSSKYEKSPYDISKTYELMPNRSDKITGNIKVKGSLSGSLSSPKHEPTKYSSVYDTSTHQSILNSSTKTYFPKDVSSSLHSPSKDESSKTKSTSVKNYSEYRLHDSPEHSKYTRNSIDMPDELKGLSAPSKVLQISQNAVNTEEGSSFYYSSVANMKILPSTY